MEGNSEMKPFKRILSAVICVVMAITMVPVISVSAVYDDTAVAPVFVSATPGEWGGAEQLFDRLYSADAYTKWCVNWSNVEHPAYVIFKYTQPVSIRGYCIVTGNDTADYGESQIRNPKTWVLYGSNDEGKTWTAVDAVAEEAPLPVANNTEVNFYLEEASPAYSYWKWEISEIVSGGCMQVNEFSLLRAGDKVAQYVEGTPGIWGMPANALDGITDTYGNSKWCMAFSGSAYVTWKYDVPMSVSSYSLFTGGDTHVNPGRNPQTWTLYGSDDGSAWEIVDVRVDDDTMGATSIGEYTFYLDKPSEAYLFFKLEITKIRDGNCLQIGEIVMHEAEPQSIDFCGYQISQTTSPTYDVRFLSTISSDAYEAVGYQMIVTYQGKTCDPYTYTTNTVYEKILGTADGVVEEYTAEELGGTYICALTLTGISAEAGDVTIVIKPFTVTDGETAFGYTYQLVLNAGAEVNCARIAD